MRMCMRESLTSWQLKLLERLIDVRLCLLDQDLTLEEMKSLILTFHCDSLREQVARLKRLIETRMKRVHTSDSVKMFWPLLFRRDEMFYESRECRRLEWYLYFERVKPNVMDLEKKLKIADVKRHYLLRWFQSDGLKSTNPVLTAEVKYLLQCELKEDMSAIEFLQWKDEEAREAHRLLQLLVWLFQVYLSEESHRGGLRNLLLDGWWLEFWEIILLAGGDVERNPGPRQITGESAMRRIQIIYFHLCFNCTSFL